MAPNSKEGSTIEALVARRRIVALGLLVAPIPLGILAVAVAGSRVGIAISLGALFALGTISVVWLYTLACPACRHPLLFSEGFGGQNYRWLTIDRCGHCCRTWTELKSPNVGKHDAPLVGEVRQNGRAG